MKLISNYKYQNFLIHHYDELDSTNQIAYNLADNRQIFDREIILANCQNKGRGRSGREWESPQGNLYFSLILQPKLSINKITQISFVACCALQKTLENFFNSHLLKVDIKNKWPNDLLVESKKISGILLESKNQNNFNEFLVVGIGVNIASNPINTIFPSTNLSSFLINILPLDLLKLFLDEFEKLYQNWLLFGFKNIRELWLKNAYNLNKNIMIKPNNTPIEGIFKNIDEEGNILIEINGKIIKFFFGDIFL